MLQSHTTSLASALFAAAIMLATWTSTLATPAAAMPAPASAIIR